MYFLQYITVSLLFPIEKPMLQSRLSLDGSKLVEKAETAQPLWVTLALQKQKGFREQQATREERKQAREAKQAEKLSREHVSSLVFSFNSELGLLFCFLAPRGSRGLSSLTRD